MLTSRVTLVWQHLAKRAETLGLVRVKHSLPIVFLICNSLDFECMGKLDRSPKNKRKGHWTGIRALGSDFAPP